MLESGYIKIVLSLLLAILLFFTISIKVRSECTLNEEDQTRFMTLYNEIVNHGKVEKIEEMHAFLKSKGCEKEIEEAEKRAREILKSQGVIQ